MTETGSVRHGEKIDLGRLGTFLEGEFGSNDAVRIEQFLGGSSNLTYLVSFGGTEYVLRRPPFGNTVHKAHDMQREHDVLSKLSKVYPPAPKPLLFCEDQTIIGSEFYLMERRRGLIIRGEIAQARASARAILGLDLESGTKPITVADLHASQQARGQVCRRFIQNLADLHSLDYQAAGLSELGHPDGYNRRQVEGWTKRYFAAKTHEWDALEHAIKWLNENIPTGSGASLVHNDYKFDNVMLNPADLGRVTAVLDWEMVTVGDPLMDLGTTLGYWMSPDAGDELLSTPFNPRVLMENVSRQQLVDMYAEAVGRTLPDMLFYYVFGTFKIAVIAQQIYARFVKGFTSDKRFAQFDSFVEKLGHIAAASLEKQTI